MVVINAITSLKPYLAPSKERNDTFGVHLYTYVTSNIVQALNTIGVVKKEGLRLWQYKVRRILLRKLLNQPSKGHWSILNSTTKRGSKTHIWLRYWPDLKIQTAT